MKRKMKEDELLNIRLRTGYSCNGHRLNEQALSVKIDGLYIGQVSEMAEKLPDYLVLMTYLKINKTQKQIAERLLKEITRRLGF